MSLFVSSFLCRKNCLNYWNKIICISLRWNNKYNKIYNNNSNNDIKPEIYSYPTLDIESGTKSFAPWQSRKITLNNQECKIPDILLQRLQGISGTIIKQSKSEEPIGDNNIDINNNDIKCYYHLTFEGDAKAIDIAMQNYIQYIQVCFAEFSIIFIVNVYYINIAFRINVIELCDTT